MPQGMVPVIARENLVIIFSQSQIVIFGISSSILDCSFSPLHEGLTLYHSTSVRLLV